MKEPDAKGIPTQNDPQNQLCVALIVHKAQGATFDRAFLLGSADLFKEAAYVGLSRGRQRNDLYVVAGGDDLEHHPRTVGAGIDRDENGERDRTAAGQTGDMVGRDGVGHEVVGGDGVAVLAGPLSHARAQRLALDTGRPGLAAGPSLADIDARLSAIPPDAPDRAEQVRAVWQAGDDRRRMLTREALADPSDYVVDRIGLPPADGYRRLVWAEAAGAVAAYRDRYQITAVSDLLGPLPVDRVQQMAYRQAAERLERAARHLGLEPPGLGPPGLEAPQVDVGLGL